MRTITALASRSQYDEGAPWPHSRRVRRLVARPRAGTWRRRPASRHRRLRDLAMLDRIGPLAVGASGLVAAGRNAVSVTRPCPACTRLRRGARRLGAGRGRRPESVCARSAELGGSRCWHGAAAAPFRCRVPACPEGALPGPRGSRRCGCAAASPCSASSSRRRASSGCPPRAAVPVRDQGGGGWPPLTSSATPDTLPRRISSAVADRWPAA